jgi:hypothetical protein
VGGRGCAVAPKEIKNCRVNTNAKFPTDAGVLSDKAVRDSPCRNTLKLAHCFIISPTIPLFHYTYFSLLHELDSHRL